MSLTGSSVGLTPLRKRISETEGRSTEFTQPEVLTTTKKEMEGKRQKTVHLKKYIIK